MSANSDSPIRCTRPRKAPAAGLFWLFSFFKERMGKTERLFVQSAGTLLALTGVAKLISARGDVRVLDTQDPLLLLDYRWVFILTGAVELILAVFLLCSRRKDCKLPAIAWLASSFAMYRLGLLYLGVTAPCRCLGTLTTALHIPPNTADAWLKGVVFYLVIGSLGILISRNLVSGPSSCAK
jgi:hypothetical protein